MNSVADRIADKGAEHSTAATLQHGASYPGARRLWSDVAEFDGMSDRLVLDALRSTFDASRAPLALRLLDVVVRGLDTLNREATPGVIRHHVLLRSDHFLYAVLAQWMVRNHERQETWDKDLANHLAPKDPRGVVAAAALYRDLVNKGAEPDELADWIVLLLEIPRDKYVTIAAIAAEILAYLHVGRA
ncbi:hypothetical protein [Paraburkholderia sp. SIMBA_054]|uniref:hypothetical protein n=1 Tax=Paraburkholderia sp. SIMBA_054 TaxID=3085795 RepID=UPI00397A0C72